VFVVQAHDAFDFLSDEYAELFLHSQATAFQHPVWLDRLYARLAPHVGAQPLIITVRSRADGRLAMVLPLLRRRRGAMRAVEFADLQVSDYVSPVCNEFTFARILHDRSACDSIRRALTPYDLVRLQKMVDGCVAIEQLLDLKPRVAMTMSAYAVRLGAPFSQWRMDNIESSYRKELDKKRRQLRRKGEIRFECTAEATAIKATFHALREYRRSRFQDGDLLQTPTYFDFYVETAILGAAAGLSRTYALLLDGRPIAGAFGLIHRGQFLVIVAGFDLANYKKQSIGSLLFEEVARDCIERGDVALDFTIGDEPYKRLFGAQPTSMWMVTQSGSPLGALANFVVDQLPWAKRIAKRMFVDRDGRASA
jgi:CelD/BcsL family acetyltransferase involved in cellulose biosynthesis